MENRHGSGAKAGSLGGKGFYIVLFLCAAVIGISAWIMFTDVRTNVENDTADRIEDVTGTYVTMLPAGGSSGGTDVPAMIQDTPAPTTTPEPSPSAETMEQTAAEEEPETEPVFADGTVSYIWPVRGEVERPYSVQTLLYDSTMADWRTHDGVDISCALGTPVMAAADGLVVEVRGDDLLGTVVEIDHRNGIHSVYANLAAQPPVAQGDEVTMGQVIGSVGGTALGEVNQVSHLHFAMRQDGITADPYQYLPSDWTE